MEIRYRANGMQRNVRDSIGQTLIDRNLATAVYATRQIVPEQLAEIETPSKPEELPARAKTKRKYTRRDMKAEQ